MVRDEGGVALTGCLDVGAIKREWSTGVENDVLASSWKGTQLWKGMIMIPGYAARKFSAAPKISAGKF